MDVIVISNNRPQRLAATLGTLLTQSIIEQRHLILVDNSGGHIDKSKPLEKILQAFYLQGWSVDVKKTELKTISEVKHFAFQQGGDEILIAVDNDVLFVRHDTISAMADVLRTYEIAAVSPLAYDIDDEHPILKNDQHYYNEVKPDHYGVAEGRTALGLCLGFRRSDLREAMQYWCTDLPYMEDQIIVHFLKKIRGYAHLHDHTIYHVSIAENPSYFFRKNEIENYLEKKAKQYPEYQQILALRRKDEDAAAFAKAVKRNENE